MLMMTKVVEVVSEEKEKEKGLDESQEPIWCAELLVPMLANLSTAYNLSVINYALLYMQEEFPLKQEMAQTSIGLVASASLIGAICGQLGFGYVGDVCGRRIGMILTLFLSVLGAIMSALIPLGMEDSPYVLLGVARFLLGVGVGGVYPLSSTAAVESSSNSYIKDKRVALVFSCQGWGQVLAPLMSYMLANISSIESNLKWRVLLLIGAIPGLLVLRSALNAPESQEFLDHSEGKSRQKLLTILKDRAYVSRLIGAAGGWFLFDITFYGNLVFTSIVLKDIFMIDNSNHSDLSRYSLFISLIALPGFYLSLLAVPKVSYKYIQLQGFLLVAMFYFLLSVSYTRLMSYPAAIVFLYGCTFLFSNFGPNVSTFCLPAKIFPSDVRVEMSGISAAFGKLGAALGVAVFKPVESNYGVSTVLMMCSLVAMTGFLVTWRFVPNSNRTLRQYSSTPTYDSVGSQKKEEQATINAL